MTSILLPSSPRGPAQVRRAYYAANRSGHIGGCTIVMSRMCENSDESVTPTTYTFLRSASMAMRGEMVDHSPDQDHPSTLPKRGAVFFL